MSVKVFNISSPSNRPPVNLYRITYIEHSSSLTMPARHVRYPSWLSTENTRKSFITHALVSKVVSLPFISHHFRSSIILTCASVFLLLFHFIYYKNLMYTTFSVVESIPPTHQSSSSPSFVQFSPVVVVSFSPPVAKSYQVLLTRNIQFMFTFTHAQSSSREAIYVHAQFTAHEEHPSSRPTPQPSVPTVPRILFSSYLRRPLGYSHRPSNAHPENHSFDSLTNRSFYSQSLLRST